MYNDLLLIYLLLAFADQYVIKNLNLNLFDMTFDLSVILNITIHACHPPYIVMFVIGQRTCLAWIPRKQNMSIKIIFAVMAGRLIDISCNGKKTFHANPVFRGSTDSSYL